MQDCSLIARQRTRSYNIPGCTDSKTFCERRLGRSLFVVFPPAGKDIYIQAGCWHINNTTGFIVNCSELALFCFVFEEKWCMLYNKLMNTSAIEGDLSRWALVMFTIVVFLLCI